MKLKEVLPRPSVKEVERYLLLWNELDNYREQEQALSELFDQYPNNMEKDRSGVLLKVVALNHFYSTNIFNVYAVAKHIVSISNFDEKLRGGDPTIIVELRDRATNGTNRDLYSFATKYCSHHFSDEYPIYDSYVHKVLDYYNRIDGFAKGKGDTRCFTNLDEQANKVDVPMRRDYCAFKAVIDAFREYYGLGSFDRKQIDQYLWQLGKDWFPNQYQGQSKDAEIINKIAKSIQRSRCFVNVENSDHVEFNAVETVKNREIGKRRAAMLILKEYKAGWEDALRYLGFEVE